MSDSIHIVCPHCQSINRLPAAKLDDQPICGRCQRARFTGEPTELTTATFPRHRECSDVPLLVDFWAPWCGPCKMMALQFHQAARLLEPKLRFAKVNTEAEPHLAIRSIPTSGIPGWVKSRASSRCHGISGHCSLSWRTTALNDSRSSLR